MSGTSGADALLAQDSAVSVQDAPSAPAGPPDTSTYMKAGYVVAGVIFVAYIALMLRRVASVRRPS